MLDDSKPLVSIITPTYNHEKFIASCVDGVLGQTYSKWEQIIIDDGSTDRTREVIRNYHDTRIQLIEQTHQGIEALAHTYNRALRAAKGSLIAILEGDDLWPPEKLSKMVGAFDDQGIVLVHGDVLDVDTFGVLARRPPRTYRERLRLPRSILFNDPVGSATVYLLSLQGQSFIAPSTVLLRRCALEMIGGFQYIRGQCSPDIPTFVRLSIEGKFHFIPEVLGFHRRHLGAATIQNLATMPLAARDYALRTCKDPTLRLGVEGQRSITDSWRTVLLRCEFAQGRISLIHGEWEKARRQFATSMNCFDGRIMIGASMGWMLSWLHHDLEGIFRLAGRPSLRQDKT